MRAYKVGFNTLTSYILLYFAKPSPCPVQASLPRDAGEGAEEETDARDLCDAES